MHGRTHPLLEVSVWWAVLFPVYLSLLSSLTPIEIAVGAGVAALGGVLAVLTRQAEWSVFRARLRWVGWLPALVADLFADTAALLALLSDAVRGSPAGDTRFHRLELPPESRPHVAHTRRAVVTILLSSTPGTYVVDTRAGEGGADELTVHRVGRRDRLAEEVGR